MLTDKGARDIDNEFRELIFSIKSQTESSVLLKLAELVIKHDASISAKTKNAMLHRAVVMRHLSLIPPLIRSASLADWCDIDVYGMLKNLWRLRISNLPNSLMFIHYATIGDVGKIADLLSNSFNPSQHQMFYAYHRIKSLYVAKLKDYLDLLFSNGKLDTFFLNAAREGRLTLMMDILNQNKISPHSEVFSKAYWLVVQKKSGALHTQS